MKRLCEIVFKRFQCSGAGIFGIIKELTLELLMVGYRVSSATQERTSTGFNKVSDIYQNNRQAARVK